MPAKAETKHAVHETIPVALGGAYTGWTAQCDADPDWGFLDDLTGALQAGSLHPIGEALLRVVDAWNFTDKTGAIAPLTEEGLRSVPARAVIELAKEYVQAWTQLPNAAGGA